MGSNFYDLKMKPLVAGAIFGASLTAAGVYHPSVIIGQMKMRDFQMLKVFLTATATSALVIPLARYFEFTTIRPSQPYTINLLGSYDSNIIGGAMLGAGMTLTGACPGTVLPQIVTGVPSSLFVGIGGILGAMLFVRYLKTQETPEEHPTLYSCYGVDQRLAILCYQLLCGGIVIGAAYFAPGDPKSLVSPIVGGLLVGLSQATSLVMTSRPLGVSGAYEATARWLLQATKIEQYETKPAKSIPFVFGAMLGSWVLSQLATLPPTPEVNISAVRGLFGGAIMVVGARLAQGCTSGHGITGMSQLSIASIISVASMFGGGMALAAVIN